MSVVWIVTTGNSDVKLSSDNGYASLKDKEIKRKALGSCYTKFPLNKVSKDEFTLPARVMGIIYGDAITTHWNYFKFPLLDSFSQELEKKNEKPDRIIVLLTDQESVDTGDRSYPDCPYWKDTCTLEPIFEHYFKDKYDVKIESVLLQPEKDQVGLDDWNKTLTLVQKKFADLGINTDDTVIVSHQAGTPAISSAVQFASLSRFGSNVKFLTSNERTGVASLDPSSSYFESMQIQEAQKLLRNYNYVGAEDVLGKWLKTDNRDIAKNILALLEVAKLWNLSKFDDFKKAMKNLPMQSLRDIATARFGGSWAWWIAYEEAYLAKIRLEQGNIVEAFFHSFRSVEGLISMWGENKFSDYVIPNNESPILKNTILEMFPDYLGKKEQEKMLLEFNEKGTLVLSGFPLYRTDRKNWKKDCKDLSTFTDKIAPKRNKLFHRLLGLQISELLEIWDVKDSDEWERRILRHLNFVSEQKQFDSFIALQKVSLMARVHEELVKEIEAIAKS
jgi:hypothetical protein